jgi:hypothetical protein
MKRKTGSLGARTAGAFYRRLKTRLDPRAHREFFGALLDAGATRERAKRHPGRPEGLAHRGEDPC